MSIKIERNLGFLIKGEPEAEEYLSDFARLGDEVYGSAKMS